MGNVTGKPPAGANVTATDPSHYFGSLPQISLSKEADRANAKVGDEINYNLTIKNLGSNNLLLTNLTDSLISLFNLDPVGKILTPKGTPGDTLIITGKYTIKDTDLPGPVVNTATIEGHDVQGNKVNSTDKSTVNLAALVVTKTADPKGGPQGSIIDYTITALNTGTSDLMVSGVDVLDAGLTYIEDDFNGTQAPKNTITWTNIFELRAGSTRVFHLKARIDGSVNGTMWNNVTLTGRTVDGKEVIGNARTDVVTQAARINVTKVAFPKDGVPGTAIEYTIDIVNSGFFGCLQCFIGGLPSRWFSVSYRTITMAPSWAQCGAMG